MSLSRFLISASLLLPASASGQATWHIRTTTSTTIPAVTAAGDVNFGLATSATRLRNGDIVIADGSSGSLLRFSPAGILLSRAGGEGSGPGEFRSLRWMGQCAVDSLWTHDLNQPRLSLLTGEGAFVRQIVPPAPADLVRCGATGQLALLTLGPPPAGGDRTVRPLGNLYAMTPAQEFVELRVGVPSTEFAMVGSMPVPFPLGRKTIVAVRGQETILGVADSAVLERIGLEGRSIGFIRLPPTTRGPTAEEIEKANNVLLMNVPATAREYLAPLLQQLPAPSRLPPYFGLWVDPADNLWVLRSPPGSPVRFTVVSPAGAILADASSLIAFTPLEIEADGILATLEGEDGELHVALLPLQKE